MKDWFAVDKKGLAQVLERKGKAFAVLELVSNAWDQTVTQVDITLEPVPNKRAKYILTVTDDDPDGFSDLTHAFTLFAPSEKKGKADKRGRFNLGEKLVLAMCDEAEIVSTKGSVGFDAKGRHEGKVTREQGSQFWAVLSMTKPEFEEVCEVIRTVIPPVNGVTRFNGDVIPVRTPVKTLTEQLPTVIADEEGNLRNSKRKTTVFLYEPLVDEVPMIYELGIPIVECGDKYHIDIGQKVPVNMDRDAVPPAYLRQLRTAVLNATFSLIDSDDANATWTKEAIEDPRVSEEAVRAVIKQRYGDKVVAFDPSDQEANRIATAQGYTVVGGRSMSSDAWVNVRKFEVFQPAGKVTPSPTMLMRDHLSQEGTEHDITVPEDKWTEGQRIVAEYARLVGSELDLPPIKVKIVSDITLNAQAYYSRGGTLTLNVGKLGHKWFSRRDELEIDELLIHEFAHERVGNHLSDEFHDECCRLGAKMRNVDTRLGNLAEFMNEAGSE